MMNYDYCVLILLKRLFNYYPLGDFALVMKTVEARFISCIPYASYADGYNDMKLLMQTIFTPYGLHTQLTAKHVHFIPSPKTICICANMVNHFKALCLPTLMFLGGHGHQTFFSKTAFMWSVFLPLLESVLVQQMFLSLCWKIELSFEFIE